MDFWVLGCRVRIDYSNSFLDWKDLFCFVLIIKMHLHCLCYLIIVFEVMGRRLYRSQCAFGMVSVHLSVREDVAFRDGDYSRKRPSDHVRPFIVNACFSVIAANMLAMSTVR